MYKIVEIRKKYGCGDGICWILMYKSKIMKIMLKEKKNEECGELFLINVECKKLEGLQRKV